MIAIALTMAAIGCDRSMPVTTPFATHPTPTSTASTSIPSAASPAATTRIEHRSQAAVQAGTPIDIATLSGRIVFDDFEDLYAMDIDGSNFVEVANNPAGPEFDGAWSPDGEWIVYRDSTRGINDNDEVFIARADGTDRRNLTNDPANDWGPDWSPDGTTIVFNSDRDGSIRAYLVNPDGSNLRRIENDAWTEYAAFSPDGKRIAFMGALGGNYELFVSDLATGAVDQLTQSPGHDAWPSWSPDGTTIAFVSHRDDCRVAPPDRECWRGDGPDDEHNDIWLIEPDGSNLRRVTPEAGNFVAWSPDSRYLLISGYALYVVRPDGTGRIEIRTDALNRALGGIPDWRAP